MIAAPAGLRKPGHYRVLASPAMSPAPRSAPADSRADRLVALADRCVQCGLCLPACPTYGLDRNEAESPRGRIALARAWELGTVSPTPEGDRHLDQCLGCRSCEAVCPAGVEYGALLVETRQRQRHRRGAGWRQAATEWLAAHPRVLDVAFAAYRRMFPLLPRALRPLPRPPAPDPMPENQAKSSAVLFTGCVAGPYEVGLRRSIIRLGAAAGTAIRALPTGCCGALHSHAGDAAGAQRLAAASRVTLAGAGTVLTLASGCHDAVHEASEAPTLDAIEYLHRRADRLPFQPRHERVALHLPCTQRNVVKSVAALRDLLARVPGLEVVELTAGYGCCGAAGTQMLLDPARAASFRAPLLQAFEDSGAARLLSANIGCRLHLANATSRPVQHPLEYLADCLA